MTDSPNDKPTERIKALEFELHQTRTAAVHMMLGMADAIATSKEGRAELAKGFEDAAVVADPVTARLARLVAAALRSGEGTA